MGQHNGNADSRKTIAAKDASTVALVARQPIFDATMNVAGYELLYRTPGAARALVEDPARATAQVMVNAALDIGLTRLAADQPVYINFPQQLLTPQLQLPLHPERVVIEVLEGCAPVEELLLTLGRLREQGYRVALDDFHIQRESGLLLQHADIVKVDVREHSPPELVKSLDALRRHPVRLVAEKIETGAELDRCRNLGFDLFQGYFLRQPEIVQTRRVPGDQQAAVELVARLNDPGVSADSIEQCIRRDMGLGCRLLRCIDSRHLRTPHQVSSMRQAIQLLGTAELRKLGWLLLAAGIAGQPGQFCVQSLQRARMCELLCEQARIGGSEAAFIAGMLSMLDVFLGLPMEQALASLPLGDAVRAALLRREGDLGAALSCAEQYERGTRQGLRLRELTIDEIAGCHRRAVEWANSRE
ncbi:MAG TPA: HDOD domain-containing protein [Steroidobacteraceae bacterium]|nr:HDOD domain-containing protein [Steroidobacteraceae bacterium]